MKVKLVACKDIGRAAAEQLKDTQTWNGRTLDCVSCNLDGNQVAAALSRASGWRCHYAVAVPEFAQKLFMGDLYHMVQFFKNGGYATSDEHAFRQVLPDAQTAQEFFEEKGQWHDKERFSKSQDGTLKDVPQTRSWIGTAALLTAIVVVAAVAVAGVRKFAQTQPE